MIDRDAVNCFTVSQRYQPIHGVPIRAGLELFKGAVSLGPGRNIQVNRNTQPRILEDNSYLYRAKAGKSQSLDAVTLVGAAKDDKVTMVRVVRKDLQFGFAPLAEGLNLWPGGDATIQPIAQAGLDKGDDSKQQLYEIEDGGSIFVIDENTAAARLQSMLGRLFIHPVTAYDLAQFMMDRALLIRIPQALDWAIHNTKTLIGAHKVASASLNGIYDQLARVREAA